MSNQFHDLMRKLLYLLFCTFFSVTQGNELNIQDICNPKLQAEIIEELLRSTPDPEKLSIAAEYILFVRSTFEKKGYPVTSIEVFCEQFNEKYKDSIIAKELTKEIIRKKDINPDCFFLPIKNRKHPEKIENETFEKAIDEIVAGVGEIVISIFALFFEQYTTAAGFAGEGAKNLKKGYEDLKQAAAEEEKKREEAKRKQEEEEQRTAI